MTRLIFIAAAGLSVALSSATAEAVVIYDSIGTSTAFTTTTGGLPRNRMADDINSVVAPPLGGNWDVTSIDVGIFANAANSNVTAEVILWNEWNVGGFGGAGTNVFQNEAGRETFALGDISTSGLYTLNFVAPISLSASTDLGVEIQLKADGVKVDSLALSLQDAAPVIGTSGNRFYRDADNDEVIETTDLRTITGWTNANTMMRINAVPEPASLFTVCVGLLALVTRRVRAA